MTEISIGGTDIAAISGLSPFKTAIEVYQEMTGLIEPFAGNEITDWGLRLEAVIAKRYSEKTGFELLTPVVKLIHHKHPWYSGSPDRLIVGQPGGLEIKNVGDRSRHFWGEPETDQVPDFYACQAHWYLELTDRDWWDFAVLFGGHEFVTYHLLRNQTIEDALIEAGKNFMEKHIVPRIPPPVDDTTAYSKFIERQFPRHLLDAEAATNEDYERARLLHEVKERIETLEAEKTYYENLLKDRIGAKEGLVHNDFSVTWKTTKDTEKTDWKGVAIAARVSKDLINQFTESKPGSRRFNFKFKGE